MKPVNRIHLKANNTKDQLIDKIEQKETLLAEYQLSHQAIAADLRLELETQVQLTLIKDQAIVANEIEIKRLNADRVKRQSAVDQGLYKLEAYRIILADVHDNIKINPEVHG